MTLQPTLVAVVVAYVAITVFVMIAFSVAYKLWPRGAFQPGCYDVTMSWNLLSLVLGFLAAVLGGWICVVIDDQPWAARSLMILVAVLGLVDVAATVKKSTARRRGRQSHGDAARPQARLGGGDQYPGRRRWRRRCRHVADMTPTTQIF